ncbi:MAG: hypothetical protein LBS36_02960 [Oscillospiraceae bacterium]|jgi:hypothetical protein|nr:hypothetical protein [Oscillospiraceae bacterium]
MNRPSFQSIDIWAEWEKDILMILVEALPSLCNVNDMTNDENDITVQLYKIILTVRYNKQKITFGNIVLQTQNQPVNALCVSENESSLRKKPDLLWVFNDENADTPEKSQRYFTIECKCLSTTADDKNYVEKGISRFILNDWGYGRNEKSAAMIGYIKDINSNVHLCRVVEHSKKHNYPEILEYVCENKHVYRYTQTFETREFEPRNFTLHHLWTHIDDHFKK